MKNTITSIIGILTIGLAFSSVSQASERERGYYSEKRIIKKIHRNDERRWNYSNHRENSYRYPEKQFRHKERHRYGDRHHRGGRYVEKHIYRHKGPRYVEKHFYHHTRPPRRVEKHVYHHYDHAPRHHVVKKVIIRDRHHHHGNALPVIAGGIIGSAIGNEVGYGDPLTTISGAVVGAMVGDVLSRH